jgi:hypothetical protein
MLRVAIFAALCIGSVHAFQLAGTYHLAGQRIF